MLIDTIQFYSDLLIIAIRSQPLSDVHLQKGLLPEQGKSF